MECKLINMEGKLEWQNQYLVTRIVIMDFSMNLQNMPKQVSKIWWELGTAHNPKEFLSKPQRISLQTSKNFPWKISNHKANLSMVIPFRQYLTISSLTDMELGGHHVPSPSHVIHQKERTALWPCSNSAHLSGLTGKYQAHISWETFKIQ